MQLGYLMVFLPLLGAILSGFFGKIIGVRNSEIITSFFVTISAILSCIIFYNVIVNSYSNNTDTKQMFSIDLSPNSSKL